jgi:hypothetical protein
MHTFDRALARVAERARETAESVHWMTAAVAAGEVGAIDVAMASDSVAEAAGRDNAPTLLMRLFGEDEGLRMLEEISECISAGKSIIVRDRPDLSYAADETKEQPIAAVVTRVTVRPGHLEACEELIRKVAEAIPKTGDPRRFTSWQPLIGDLRKIGSVRPVYNLSELDEAAPLPALLDQAFGAAEGGLIYRAGLEAIEHAESELLLLRPDLSYPAG